MARNADIRGFMLFAAPPAVLVEAQRALIEGLEKGALHPLIAHSYPLAEAAAAHTAIMNSKATGKIVLLT